MFDTQLREAVALHGRGEFAHAARIYEQILSAHPQHFDALHLLGVIAAATGKPQRALELIGKALEINPRSAVAHNNRGAALQELGQTDAALAHYEQAALLDPHYPEPHFNRGICFADRQQADAALACFDRAIASRPQYAEAYYRRGNVLCTLRRWIEALASFDQAIAFRGGDAQCFCNRAFALRELGRLSEALESCDRAIALQPTLTEAHANRAGVLVAANRTREALPSYDRAIALDPARASHYVNRALARLRVGDFERGWQDYEWRWKDTSGWIIREKRNFPAPLWLGDASLEGRTLLLVSEQGFGDTIQFCRYAAVVAALGARVILEVPQALVGLLRHLDGVAECVAQGDALPPFDFYCPLLSVPHAVGTSLSDIPARIPYLIADDAHRRKWRERLGSGRDLRVGLVWSGGHRPSIPALWSANERRNIPLRVVAPLKMRGVQFYSLQKGEAAVSDLAALTRTGWSGPSIIDLTRDLSDFEDTAAMIEQLDLVISVDTATAHLAGALGKPVWILNRFDSCWRWLEERSDSPWYPTATLYRQERAGDWDSVIGRVSADLRARAESRALHGA